MSDKKYYRESISFMDGANGFHSQTFQVVDGNRNETGILVNDTQLNRSSKWQRTIIYKNEEFATLEEAIIAYEKVIGTISNG